VNRTRRELAVAVLACAAGAGLVLLAASRTWSVTQVIRPAPQPQTQTTHTGVSIIPWIDAVALVGLAGAGALLATRGRARTVVGVLLIIAGIGVLGGGIDAAATASHVQPVWPVLCSVGGLAICYGGLIAVLRGRGWPAMGRRYERPISEPVEYVERGGPSRSDVAMWDALDRGEDPTRRGE
jgi:hypothetical protein